MSDSPRDDGPPGAAGLIALAGLAVGGIAVILLWLPDGRGRISERQQVVSAIKTMELVLSAMAIGAGWRSLRSLGMSDITRSWRGKFAVACMLVGGAGILLMAWMTFVTRAR